MIALIIQTLFSVIMAWDAWQRRCQKYWFLIIALPFGEIYYFFQLYMRGPEFRGYRSGELNPSKALKKARRDFNVSPSLHHRRTLARTLLATGAHQEALEVLEPFSHQHSQDLAFQYLLGQAHLANDQPDQAIAVLEPMATSEPKAFDFGAWLFLVAAYARRGEMERALGLMQKLQQEFPRLKHQLTMAAYLAKTDQINQAKAMLRNAILTYEGFPTFLHWEHGFWAREARLMLRAKQPLPK